MFLRFYCIARCISIVVSCLIKPIIPTRHSTIPSSYGIKLLNKFTVGHRKILYHLHDKCSSTFLRLHNLSIDMYHKSSNYISIKIPPTNTASPQFTSHFHILKLSLNRHPLNYKMPFLDNFDNNKQL